MTGSKAFSGIDMSRCTLAKPRRDYRRPEAIVEAAVMQLYAAIGATVNKSSAAVHAKGVTAGIPDLFIQHEAWQLEWFHEVKPPGRRQSLEQLEFANRCARIGRTAYVLGGVDGAEAFLYWVGIGVLDYGALRLISPRSLWLPRVLRAKEAGVESWVSSPMHGQMQIRYGYREPTRRRRR